MSDVNGQQGQPLVTFSLHGEMKRRRITERTDTLTALGPDIIGIILSFLNKDEQWQLFNTSLALQCLIVNSDAMSLIRVYNPFPNQWFFPRIRRCYINTSVVRTIGLPLSVTEITLVWRRLINEATSEIRSSVTHLLLASCDIWAVFMATLPITLKSLVLNYCQLTGGLHCVTSHLTYLEIHSDRESLRVDGCLPETLRSLVIISSKFSGRVNHLPGSLTILIIHSRWFHQGVDNLPASLLYLEIKSPNFNKSLNSLPGSLKYLVLEDCRDFNQPMDRLPPNLVALYIGGGESFEGPLDRLPSTSLTHLFMRRYSDFPGFLDYLPSSLTHLMIYCYYEDVWKLPSGLTNLVMEDCPEMNRVSPAGFGFTLTEQLAPLEPKKGLLNFWNDRSIGKRCK